MITKRFLKDDAFSEAMYSECRKYRYYLSREWDVTKKRAHFIMLNPSTATEYQNDPTVERCERRARSLGYGAFAVTNIFAWRETNPKQMEKVSDPIGAQNDSIILETCKNSNINIAAWGTHGSHLARGTAVREIFIKAKLRISSLGITKMGHPKHPLYISYQVKPQIWLNGDNGV